MIELSEVTKTYGDVTPIRNVNLEVEDGEFVSIMGPSGSGKSTLLNTIAGLSTPSQGEVKIAGVSIYELDARARAAFRRMHFGFIFQSFNLIPYLTAAENVQVPLYLAGVEQKKQAIMAGGLLKQVGLEDKAQRFQAQLSVGEQQRVAIARALANKPRIILADEPTGNLDSSTGREVMRHMQHLNEEGVTILLVTHDTDMAGLAKRQIQLVGGTLS